MVDPASAPRLVLQRPWCVLSCLWDGAYKDPLTMRVSYLSLLGARCSSVVRTFVHGAMGCRIDPLWWTH